MSVPLICVTLLGFLGIGLGFTVSTIRARLSVVVGSPAEPESILYRAIRAHGNTMEYAPLLALLIYILGQSHQPTWVIWFMALATLSRYLFAAGMIFHKTAAERNPMRLIGAMGTYVFGIGLCTGLLLQLLNT